MALEGALVARVARQLDDAGWRVVVARPSQTRIFFTVNGRRKAPDLVAWRNGELLVLEAKVHASALFREDEGGFSDYWCMQALASQPGLQDQLIERVKPMLRGVADLAASCPRFLCGLLAGQAFSHEQIASAAPLLCLHADAQQGVISGGDALL